MIVICGVTLRGAYLSVAYGHGLAGLQATLDPAKAMSLTGLALTVAALVPGMRLYGAPETERRLRAAELTSLAVAIAIACALDQASHLSDGLVVGLGVTVIAVRVVALQLNDARRRYQISQEGEERKTRTVARYKTILSTERDGSALCYGLLGLACCSALPMTITLLLHAVGQTRGDLITDAVEVVAVTALPPLFLIAVSCAARIGYADDSIGAAYGMHAVAVFFGALAGKELITIVFRDTSSVRGAVFVMAWMGPVLVAYAWFWRPWFSGRHARKQHATPPDWFVSVFAKLRLRSLT